MKYDNPWKPISLISAGLIVGLWAISGSFESRGAGSLTPPDGPPTPVMATQNELAGELGEIRKAVNSSGGSSGMNFGVRTSSAALVWDSRDGSWSQQNGTFIALIESDGNFLAYNNSTAVAWSKETGAWKSTAVSGSTLIAESQGNFCIAGGGKASAWNFRTGEWTPKSIASILRLARSNGNFCVVGASEAAAWDQSDSRWHTRGVSNVSQVIGAQ